MKAGLSMSSVQNQAILLIQGDSFKEKLNIQYAEEKQYSKINDNRNCNLYPKSKIDI